MSMLMQLLLNIEWVRSGKRYESTVRQTANALQPSHIQSAIESAASLAYRNARHGIKGFGTKQKVGIPFRNITNR